MPGAHSSQKKALGSLKPGVTDSHELLCMLMLGTKPGSPGRTAGALDLWATSSAPLTLLFNLLLKHTHTHHTQARVHTHTASALVEERLLKSSPYGLWVIYLQMIRRRFRKHL